MKKLIYALFLAAIMIAVGCNFAIAKDDAKNATVEYALTPAPHCQNCVNKIKGNLRFEKGVKAIDVDLDKKTVKIEYSPKATTPEKLTEALAKIGYTAKPYDQQCSADSCSSCQGGSCCE